MYKLLLCTKYLRTRYLAFICVGSVTLGVATLIVVNGVMSGFSNKLKDRLHGILADGMVETERDLGLEETPAELTARLMASPAGQHIEAVSPTVEVFALLQFHVRDKHGQKVPITKHVRVIGIDPVAHAKVGRFSSYLKRQKDSPNPSFDLTPEAMERFERNRLVAEFDDPFRMPTVRNAPPPVDFLKGPEIVLPGGPSPIVPPPIVPAGPPPRLPGAILGYAIAHQRYPDPDTGEMKDYALLRPGDDILIATVGSGAMKPVYGTFAVVDYFQSEMSEYDGSFVYVPLDELQRLRAMDGKVNALQLKLRDGKADDVRFVHEQFLPEVRKLFPPDEARVMSWQQHQGPLLAAIDIERGILNLLLFMIVGVAGFSVLAIFTMIVSEKYRDIGVLKSLGASNQGIMGIFVGYGLLLGLVGAILGTGLGLLITWKINQIETFLTSMTGQQIFDRSVYYFDEIPTNIEPLSVGLIILGSVAIAVLFSVLPAWRAARLHPVRALRFE